MSETQEQIKPIYLLIKKYLTPVFDAYGYIYAEFLGAKRIKLIQKGFPHHVADEIVTKKVKKK